MDTIARWHDYARSRDLAQLDALIAEDCVFRSPAVHSAQVGKAITIRYLSAATEVLGGPDFRYTGEWRADKSAVLEFETAVDGMAVNGVDIIRWDDDGRIISFKVMARPIRGLQALIPAMAAACPVDSGSPLKNIRRTHRSGPRTCPTYRNSIRYPGM